MLVIFFLFSCFAMLFLGDNLSGQGNDGAMNEGRMNDDYMNDKHMVWVGQELSAYLLLVKLQSST